SNEIFLGFEHPLSETRVDGTRIVAFLPRKVPLRPGSPVTYSSVIGAVRPGQLRREFLRYVERERAHPYRTFLHYNSWYDLGYFTPYDEAGAVDRINAFGEQLHVRRGVTLNSFLFDDGWDDHASLWHFNSGFPHGFTPLRDAAAKYGAAPGIWLSPWGGYGKPRDERLQHGREAGFETNQQGFALSGPKYFERFRETCLRLIRDYGINQFKIDGTGNANSVIPGSKFDSDFAAAISLISDLRAAKPDLYVNMTTGTYPSPFWLQYADSIWRGGSDHDFAGVGSFRQQWITYRDGATYNGVVKRGPLFPLNSLMLHGLIYAQFAKNLNTDPDDDFTSEVHDYFGTGTQLQEMYITPSLLSAANWDAIAQAAKWSRANAATLVDTHWIGGDPRQLQVYGWAAWSPTKGILTLRNPSDKPQSFVVDVQQAFELPPGAPTAYRMLDPYGTAAVPVELRAGESHTFALQPFQVLTLESDSTGRR
ncbi:MAG: enterotoxin, partial [Vicinamibacterales bacterium]